MITLQKFTIIVKTNINMKLGSNYIGIIILLYYLCTLFYFV